MNTQKRIKNPVTLMRLGQALRQRREQLGLAQSKVRGMRQATVSKLENGGDVTLDTLVSHASALGLEVALVPIGQGKPLLFGQEPTGQPSQVLDLLAECNDLVDRA
ncbi:MAG: helix-turn-helix transcriptional regulator [Hydrogenophaga sp.]|uniref:helix-turn-helix domain-containing protein n=1 Tax=Hydrogenophaga sp. TaxID=1904254 RepID=UPI0027762AEA|nr:helix-turn-helix transcriptional regulator [Hydrogenophaga sp.]MDP2415955.1 helix-turn-helix transcriptional regulator [Hydrogenophaga sp.]MDZ4189046.1 helix-turn-helix transcriptional regulator [Hydrogenophaga sp.]